jgi:hypothetical protein
MKRLFVIPTLLVFAVVLVSTTLSSPHSASAARPLTGGGSGSEAHASFSSESGGVQTFTFVDAHDESFSGPGGSFEGSFVFIDITQFDPGTNVTRSFVGDAELAPNQFQVSGDLSLATLDAEVTVCERRGTECLDLTVDITWSGTGQTRTASGKSKTSINGCRIHSTFSNPFRDATATGTVSDGTTNYTPDPSDFATISTFSSQDTFIGDCSSLFPPPPPGP